MTKMLYFDNLKKLTGTGGQTDVKDYILSQADALTKKF